MLTVERQFTNIIELFKKPNAMALSEDFDDEMSVVFTCGMCETICENYQGQGCLKKYAGHYIDNNYYCYPLLEDKVTIIRRVLLDDGREALIKEKINSENKENETCTIFDEISDDIPKSQQKERTNNKTKVHQRNTIRQSQTETQSEKLSEIEVEFLLNEVQKRPPLWDHTISLTERNRETIPVLWAEVSRALKGKIDANECKKKFKSVRDTYRRLVQNENQPSGSARAESTREWKYYRCFTELAQMWMKIMILINT